jgi:hypothetical protein
MMVKIRRVRGNFDFGRDSSSRFLVTGAKLCVVESSKIKKKSREHDLSSEENADVILVTARARQSKNKIYYGGLRTVAVRLLVVEVNSIHL